MVAASALAAALGSWFSDAELKIANLCLSVSTAAVHFHHGPQSKLVFHEEGVAEVEEQKLTMKRVKSLKMSLQRYLKQLLMKF